MDVLFNADTLLTDILNEAMTISAAASSYASNKIKDELNNTYKDIIKQYYEYKTTSYYRHKTGIGTGTGWNLYRSDNIHLFPLSSEINNNERADGLSFDINADRMYGYPRINKDIVLDNVLDGIRGVPNKNPSWLINKKTNMHMMMFQREREFEASVKIGKKTIKGTPRDIMSNLIKQMQNGRYERYWRIGWNNEIKGRKYEFFKPNDKFSFGKKNK